MRDEVLRSRVWNMECVTCVSEHKTNRGRRVFVVAVACLLLVMLMISLALADRAGVPRNRLKVAS